MKTEFENLPELQEAFEAVKGQLFGPLNAALVRHKHQEILQDAKEKRVQAIDPHGRLSLAGDDPAERDRKDRDSQTRTLTWLLANNSAYAALHADANKAWRDADDAAEDALRQIEKALEEARIDQRALLERAPLINGKRVFRDDDGSVWTEDDVRLPDEVADGIQWRGDEPTRNEFKAGQARIDALIRSGDRVRGIQVEVADLGAELNDDKNPPNTERTEEIIQDLQNHQREIEENLPKPASREIEARTQLPIAMPAVPADVPIL